MSEEKKPAPAPAPPARPAPPPPKNPGFITFSVDGKEVVAKPGTNMIDAAKLVGVDIPYYCYHHRLSIAANCRMCLIESSTMPNGKLIPACQTPIAENMVITTTSEKVAAQRKLVMEYLLLNHPVDCAICDQAGECRLQDYYMQYDHQPSRLDGPKVLKQKRKILNDTVMLDQERCISCTRCVRFMAEVAQAPQLAMFERGSHQVIDIAPEYGKLESNYSGNIVDICPVGALTNRDFRFRARAWFLSAVPSVCTGCSRGCSITADYMGQDVYRYRPRENEAINKSWMCDQGRLTYKSLNQKRLATASLGRGEAAHEATPDEALKDAAEKLTPVLGQVAFLASPVASNEDLLAAFAFARDALKTSTVYVGGRPAGEADFLLMQADKNPNRKGLEAIAAAFGFTAQPFEALTKAMDAGQVKALFAVGHEVPEDEATFAGRLAKLDVVVMTATNHSPVTAAAQVLLPASTHVEDEGTFTQSAGITQRFRKAFPSRGDARPHWSWVSSLSKRLGVEAEAESSREVWRRLAPSVPEFATFDWDAQAPRAQTKQGIATMAAAADGRPPGWREQGAPNLNGLTLLTVR